MTAPRKLSRALVACLVATVAVSLAVSRSDRATTRADDTIQHEALFDEASADELEIYDTDREHWSFTPLARPAVPMPADLKDARGAIDCFIAERLAKRDLEPLPEADRVTLIRRLSFDLVGLPPTPDEVDAFVADDSPDAYERLVDRLLASPHYGQRWGQHWLDLARFAETDGFEHDKLRPEAWRYRDWVIDALNADLPYDRFVALQLAGDEVAPDDPQSAIATAFCLSGPDMPDINSQEERRQNLLTEMTATVGSVFMALQVGCAQCHDHKYDPVSQADFYRLRTIFEPAVQVEANKSVFVLHEDSAATKPGHLLVRGDWRRPGAEVKPAFPRILNVHGDQVPPPPEGAATTRRRTALANWLIEDDHPLTSRVMANRVWQHHFGAGLCRTTSDFGIAGEEPSHPELLDWLASDLVNRGWSLKRLHGRIVASAAYRRASRVNRTGLSDDDLAESQAHMAHLLEADPANRSLGRFPRQRLEGEAVRDAMLAAAGALNTRMGGPGIMPPLPKELLETVLADHWKVTPDPAEHDRRSIYVFARRNLRLPILEVFDRPDANASCPRRNRSTTAVQSLLMVNSDFSLTAARKLAGAVLAGSPNDANEQVRLVFRRALSREPEDDERMAAVAFLADQTQLLKDEGRDAGSLARPDPMPDASGESLDVHEAAALVDLCLAVLNSSEFLYVD